MQGIKMARLTYTQKSECIECFKNGESISSLAKEYKSSKTTINKYIELDRQANVLINLKKILQLQIKIESKLKE